MDHDIQSWMLQHWLITACLVMLLVFIFVRILSLVYQAFIGLIDQILLKIVQIPAHLLSFCLRYLPFGSWLKARFLQSPVEHSLAQPKSLTVRTIAPLQASQFEFTTEQYAEILAQLQEIRTQQTQLELLLIQLTKAQQPPSTDSTK